VNIYIEDPEGVVEQEVAAGLTRKDVALTYALAMWCHFQGQLPVDWPRINRAILTRWKSSGLTWIKESAWKLYDEKKAAAGTPGEEK
jgi:hypothetical protein